MSTTLHTADLTLEGADNRRLTLLCGPFDDNLKHVERRLLVEISQRDNQLKIAGPADNVAAALDVLQQLYAATALPTAELTPEQVHLLISENYDIQYQQHDGEPRDFSLKTKKGLIKPRNPNQAAYVGNVLKHDVCFGIGPAGTGKTYLAVACAVDALERNLVRRIVLTRPAVEAGEKLGFLPGDLAQKVDPYLRPLYDALFEMLGFEKVEKYLERGIIEIAPLAYMRGRTLNDAFIILDESQNTTVEQMKMFLTRIGFSSKAVITGDITQVDLPRGQYSGLKHAIDVLSEVDEISFNHFTAKDVVRHPIVQRIVMAYEAFEAAKAAADNAAKGQ
ncbi:phosphate starvation-inducible PhoH-like protein [Rheinheimera pacifica]|uniref:PhoH family protein n=1 Tax=Rheinheimera pacifica TaxID=173990 RepID=UPI00285ECAFA|nr:PhoH family protein [Rheinheimera pacifica]MDR6983387.1 phosphate starvation-inducible PhoH-like protein [Rheinheimera pacifica]